MAQQPTVATGGNDLVDRDDRTVNVVETPTSPSSAFTLSRFEFETGTKGNEGTKILMVEWDPVAAAAATAAAQKEKEEGAQQEEEEKKTTESETTTKEANLDDWEVKWEGKEALLVLPIRDTDTPASTCRMYFLLPPKAPIPTLVTISSISGTAAAAAAAAADLHTKPLPAIFPEGLINEDKGTRGVLHTIWAKKRLEQLEAEMADEMKKNGESVAVEMALQERQWIVEHFGLQIDMSSAEAIPLAQSPNAAAGAKSETTKSPASPRSPIGGRLGEKLKGLKLATSPAGLAAAKEAQNKSAALAAATASSAAQPRQVVGIAPDFQPRSMATGGSSTVGGGMASLSAVVQGSGAGAESLPGAGGDTEEDLFALPMSPRSPEMAISPFSLLKS